jgi:hypothetical protein
MSDKAQYALRCPAARPGWQDPSIASARGLAGLPGSCDLAHVAARVFSAGLPLLLVFGTLSFWLREGINRTTIGST